MIIIIKIFNYIFYLKKNTSKIINNLYNHTWSRTSEYSLENNINVYYYN